MRKYIFLWLLLVSYTVCFHKDCRAVNTWRNDWGFVSPRESCRARSWWDELVHMRTGAGPRLRWVPGLLPWVCPLGAPHPRGDTREPLGRTFYGSIPLACLGWRQAHAPKKVPFTWPFLEKGSQVQGIQQIVNSVGFIPSFCTRDSTLPILENMCLCLQNGPLPVSFIRKPTPRDSGGWVSASLW